MNTTKTDYIIKTKQMVIVAMHMQTHIQRYCIKKLLFPKVCSLLGNKTLFRWIKKLQIITDNIIKKLKI